MELSKSKIYRRLFLIYTCVTIFIVGTLDLFFIVSASHERKKNNLYINERIVNDIEQAINNYEDTTNLILNMLYNNDPMIYDIISFLHTDTVRYVQSKLDKFSDDPNYYYIGIEYFVKSAMDLNESIKSISFISYSRKEVSSFNRKRQIKVDSIQDSGYKNKYNTPDVITGKDSINYIREIRDPISFEPEGAIVINYNLNKINKVIDKYNRDSNVLLLSDNGDIIYNSQDTESYGKYKYFDEIQTHKNLVKLDHKSYITKIVHKSGITILSTIKKSDASRLTGLFYQSAIFIGLFVFFISEAIIYIKVKNLNDRMNEVILAMDSVKHGNVNIEIPISNEKDEINFISENFNDMCKQLNDYIEKSYLSDLNQKSTELSQKKAEIVALQNQINPHFLYNTLESIRMKAICNGDKEVGKMLYTLAFLFRSQVKEKIIVSIEQEISYCKKYLEIFKFRYDDNFKFEIICDEDVLDKQIIKFTLQPLIENYFIHGIRLEDEDNEIKISISKDNEDIVIKLIENGKGILPEKLDDINRRLKTLDYSGKSIGILNVHERILIKYGQNYGIKLMNNKGKGTTTIVKFPCKEVE